MKAEIKFPDGTLVTLEGETGEIFGALNSIKPLNAPVPQFPVPPRGDFYKSDTSDVSGTRPPGCNCLSYPDGTALQWVWCPVHSTTKVE